AVDLVAFRFPVTELTGRIAAGETDIGELAHLARPQGLEAAALHHGGLERQLRAEAGLFLIGRRQGASLVIDNADVAVLEQVETVGASDELEGTEWSLKLHAAPEFDE